jgi:hypothetical protein
MTRKPTATVTSKRRPPVAWHPGPRDPRKVGPDRVLATSTVRPIEPKETRS